MAKLKTTVSKNAKAASRKRNERIKYDGKEVDPVLIKLHPTMGTFMAAMYIESKEPVLDQTGTILRWNQVSAIASRNIKQ
jgi:hypothetical protein